MKLSGEINHLFIETLRRAELENKKEYVIAAIWSLMKYIQKFYEKGYLESIVYQIALKKINFLMDAKTRSEVKEILRPSAPIYNGNGFIPNGIFHVEEEELLLWSEASLMAPLKNEGCLRYQYLFQKYILKKQHDL